MVTIRSRLEFNLSIVSTIKDNISTQQLLERLAQLQEELSSLKQETVELGTVHKYKSDLIHKKILKNKDHGVRAFTACCLSDILRLYAPDAPYTDKELTDIFQLFLEQFKLFQEPENGYIIQQTYLATNLLEYRSIVLLTDLPSSTQLVSELFEIFYSPQSNVIQEKLFTIIGGLLGEVISECDSMPMSALKLVFNKFLSHKREKSLNGLSYKKDPGFEFSLAICQTYSNRLGRHFIKFYSEIMYEALEDNDDQNKGKLSPGYKTLVKLGNLTSELWKYAPDLVGSVTGFIYQLLCSENEFFREAATKCVSAMLETSSLINFAVAHSDTYKIWLSKMADISSQVRITWVRTVPQILGDHSDLAGDISKGLAKALIDSDHAVRLCAVQVFQEVPVKKLWECISNSAVFSGLLHLTRETRSDIRDECIEAVAKIYVESVEQIPKTNENREAWKVVDTIPSVFFNLYYINEPDINMKVDVLLFDNLLPLILGPEALISRLLNMMNNFDEKAFSSFYAFNKRQEQMSVVVSKLISFCEGTYSSDISLAESSNLKLEKTVEWLNLGYPPQSNAREVLAAFRELNDRRLYHLIKTAVTDTSDHSTVRNAITELFKRLDDPELFRKKNVKIDSRFTRDNFMMVIKVLIYRAAPIVFNVSNVSVLLSNTNSLSTHETSLKRQLIDNLCVIKPGIFKHQAKSLIEIIMRLDESTTNATGTLTLTEAMRTLYKISKSNIHHLTTSEPFFLDKLDDYARDGSILAAKYAIKLLGLLADASDHLLKIKNSVLPLNTHSKYFAANVSVVSQIFKLQPHLLDDDSTEIVSLLIKDVLLANEVVGDKDGDPLWISENEICMNEERSPLASKLFSLKLFTNKLKSMVDDVQHDEMARAFTERILKLFFYLIASGGELISEHNKESYPTPSNYQNKLRCYAGLQILKLAKVANLSSFVKPADIGRLINLVEDESIEVRTLFIANLKDNVGNETISIRYLPLIFFTAYEPDPALKTSTKMWISLTLKKENFKKGTFFERALPRLIHSIAHHPDVAEGIQTDGETFLSSLTTAIGYLVFYFHSVANAHNLALLYYLAGRVRQYRDTIAQEEDDERVHEEEERQAEGTNIKNSGIYIISELAQLVLGQFKDHNEWALSSYPGKLNLPSDLFEPFETIEDARKNTFESFVKTEDIDNLKRITGIKIARIYKRVSTHKLPTHKRSLTVDSPQLKKRSQVSSTNDRGGDGDEYHDHTYIASTSSRQSLKETRRSSRQRKTVDYVDSESDEE
ncbi:LANO_0D04940g1_1 [Lachancea nothofagi CBS 11611]|uniref:LANO_0D04940g1_1 n=1 Tax=Lachancea nothofagi CBS 11611 TaxID=1266666 RepID=A0A1G4JGI5_9SACH|nr:LANO_0D04940g1_1 [Lachancea nothofagi CBS 11611]